LTKWKKRIPFNKSASANELKTEEESSGYLLGIYDIERLKTMELQKFTLERLSKKPYN